MKNKKGSLSHQIPPTPSCYSSTPFCDPTPCSTPPCDPPTPSCYPPTSSFDLPTPSFFPPTHPPYPEPINGFRTPTTIPEVRSPSPSVWSRASSPFLPGSDTTATSSKTYDVVAFGNPFCALKVLVIRGSQVLVEELVSMISSKTLQTMSITFSIHDSPSPLHNSAEEVAAIVSSMAQVRWRNTLSTLSLRLFERDDAFSRSSSRCSGLPSASFKNLLCMPKLEHLDLSGTPLSSLESGFNHLSKGTTKLKTLFLPDDATAPGISLARLQVLAVACPNLASLRCKLKHLSNIPAPRDLPPIPFSHTLETLLIGNAEAHPDPQRVLDIARYLDFLFPHLKTIETISGQNEAQWMSIFSVVKVCQAVRLDERERLGASIHG